MDKQTLENWKKVEANLRAAGKTDCYFYKRAVIILKGGKDPLK